MTNTKLPRLIRFVGLAPLAFLVEGTAQDDEEDDVFELSPFVVEGSEDVGYMSTQSLAGTRIKSNLRDVATTVQSITKEMLDDIGANDLNELLSYTTSTEAGGDLGNFTGVNVGGTNVGADAGARAEPQTNLRVRGMGAPDLTRGYFLTNIGFDSYNTERVEINRGANAILFGLGSPAGVVNNSLLKAQLNSDRGQVKVRFGEHRSFRSEIDYNKVLIDDKFAIRVAALYDDQQYQQRPAFERDNRIYLAGTLKLDDRSSLRFNTESGDITANRPSVIAPTDWVSGWLLSGKPIHDLYYDGTPNVVAGVNSRMRDINDLTQGWVGVPEGIELDLGEGTIVNSSDAIDPPRVNSPGFFAYGTIAVYDALDPDADVYGLSNLQSNHWPKKGSVVHPLRPDHVNSYRDYRMRDTAGLRHLYGDSATGVEEQGLNDRTLFDWVNNLIGGNTADQNTDFQTFSGSIDRLFLPEKNLGIEIAYDYQSYKSDAFSPFQDRFAGISIDSNPHLPLTAEGVLQPNPNYLRPYIFTRYNRRDIRDNTRTTARATAFYDLNLEQRFDSKWLSWLGKHTFTGLVNSQTIEQDFQRLELHHTDPFFSRFANQPLGTGFNTLVNQRIYVGPAVSSDVASFSDIQINSIQGIDLWDTETFVDYTMWNGGIQPGTENTRANGNTAAGAEEILRIGGPDGFGNLQNFSEPATAYVINASKAEDIIDTQAINLQSRLFGGNLVGTLGLRSDEIEVRKSNEIDFARDELTNEILFDSLDVGTLESSTADIDTKTWGVVGYLPRQWVELPFKSDISFHYGESENFRPEAGRVNHMNEVLEDPGGDTEEFGLTITMFDRKLSARLNWFETNLTNRSRGYSTGQFINLWTQRPDAYMIGAVAGIGDPDPVINAGGELMYAAAQAIVDSVPAATKELYNIRFVTDAEGVVTNVARDNATISDTEDLSAEGVELELVYNPTPSWRIGLNVAQQETTATNVNPNARLMAEQVLATLDTEVPGYDGLTIGEMPSWFFYGWDPSREGGLRFQDPESSTPPQTLREWNETSFQTLRTSLAAEGTQSPEQREWRVNLVTNYKFREGPLKGLAVGGAYRYESDAIVDYPLVPNEDGNLVGDIENPYKNDSTENFDFWVGYDLKVLKDIRWEAKINVRNAFASEDDFIPVSFHQGGALAGMISRVRYAPQRTIFFTNTFKF
ncbi:MAG: TonB-dependent receptor plug domain-containing protein [Verrucomicrobiota bacterium]